MSNLFEVVKKLQGYQYNLWEYKASHSTLILHAERLENPKESVYLHFLDVCFIQMPTSWQGDFEIGTDIEYEEVLNKAGIKGAPEIHKDAISLYKIDIKTDTVYILGKLILIE